MDVNFDRQSAFNQQDHGEIENNFMAIKLFGCFQLLYTFLQQKLKGMVLTIKWANIKLCQETRHQRKDEDFLNQVAQVKHKIVT